VAARQVAEALEVDPPGLVDPAGDTLNGLVLGCGRGVLGLDELEGRFGLSAKRSAGVRSPIDWCGRMVL
jgi:hypothetical protein